MTTLAYDGRTLAIESQVTQGSLIASKCEKKMYVVGYCFKLSTRFENVLAFAYTGELDVKEDVVAWFLNKDIKTKPDGDYSIYFLKDNFAYSIMSNRLAHKNTSKLSSDGSGHVIAMSAMTAGNDAREAVEVACKLDVYSGGKVQYFDSQTHAFACYDNDGKFIEGHTLFDDEDDIGGCNGPKESPNKLMEYYAC